MIDYIEYFVNGLFSGLQLRCIEEPKKNRMPAEQGGTERIDNNIGSRSVVLLPACDSPQYEYGAEYSRIESWLDENPNFVQDYFIRYKLDDLILTLSLTIVIHIVMATL